MPVNVPIVLLSLTFPRKLFDGSSITAGTKNPTGNTPFVTVTPAYTPGLTTLIVLIVPVSVKDVIITFAARTKILVFAVYPFSPSIMSSLINCGIIPAFKISLVFVAGLINLLADIFSIKKSYSRTITNLFSSWIFSLYIHYDFSEDYFLPSNYNNTHYSLTHYSLTYFLVKIILIKI